MRNRSLIKFVLFAIKALFASKDKKKTPPFGLRFILYLLAP